MMARLEGEQTLMRIYIGENDRWRHRPLHEVLVEFFRAEGFSGATVLKGVMGFGERSITHTGKLLRLSSDLPVVVEVVEAAEKIVSVLPRLDEMIGGGMITMEKVRVIRYSRKEQEKKDVPPNPGTDRR